MIPCRSVSAYGKKNFRSLLVIGLVARVLKLVPTDHDRCCFCIGSVMSGILITNESFAIGRSYGRAAMLEAFFLFIAACRCIAVPDKIQYAYICAIAMGIQNGISTRFSGNVLRTTHFTGITTDIG